MKFAASITLLILSVFFPSSLLHAGISEEITNAQNSYNNKDYDASLSQYYKLQSENSDLNQSALFYNMAANAYNLKKYGLSLAYFLMAKKHNAGDSDINHNIKILENHFTKGQRAVPATKPLLSKIPIVNKASLTTWYIISLSLHLATLLLLKAGKITYGLTYIFLTGFIVSLTFTVQAQFANSLKTAVAISDETVVRSGPDESFPEITKISEGSIVEVSSQESNWFKVRFTFQDRTDSVTGWASAKNVYPILYEQR